MSSYAKMWRLLSVWQKSLIGGLIMYADLINIMCEHGLCSDRQRVTFCTIALGKQVQCLGDLDAYDISIVKDALANG